MNTYVKLRKDIIRLIKESILLYQTFEHVYLFGSMLKPCVQKNDIDILVIYKLYSPELSDDLKLFSQKLEEASGMLVDITALSIEEEAEVAFLERIKSNCLKLK